MLKCIKCHKTKKLEDFVIDKKTKTGRRNTCKDCFNSHRRNKTDLKNKEVNKKIKMHNSLGIRECKKCKKIKPFDSFVKNKLCVDGIEFLCLSCRNERLLKWRKENPGKKKECDKNWRENNKEYKKQIDRKYRIENKGKRIEYDIKRGILKRKELKEYRKKYVELNREQINKNTLERKKNDIQYNLACKLRTRIHTALNSKGIKKNLKHLDLLGCSFEELKQYLESKFTDGMNWDKLGRYGIHIDHIKPLAMFDLSDEKQLRQACHYTNLQPLWAKDNLSKGARWIE